jgi:DNA-binding transcriptional MocR family regulator
MLPNMRLASALDITLRMLCNPGASVLTEHYTYPGMLDSATSLGLNVFGVAIDEHGLVPSDPATKLHHWHGTKPSILYTILTSHSPTDTS